ncbi:hypothetical protein PTTG_04851 [Puccinia triticina 1-1 BBBD Race 1]|uniref:Uncharacterized protein n=2 Tax=Puccinia triticina TaxID=208348 RepID=A0A180GTM8_PUCT1|nr:uncharacterized protein PtA15_14A200 [Puccinia triticina]OAV95739.1 hypothetical protein PTTG_04851 [Puccinia triticina 1-1 BBBD Race 1]WAQ91317.1 hypothetical protein PtA15_14A200 [Puccinia triticina]WAR62122.1 hypothetical protein PtB15_14B216 [Puccinia triticina]
MAGGRRAPRPPTDPIAAAHAAGLFTRPVDQVREDGLLHLQSLFSFGTAAAFDPLPEALAILARSKAEGRRRSELLKDFLVRVFATLVPLLQEGRSTHWWDDKEHYRNQAPFRIERDLLPRLRRRIVELCHVMHPRKLKTDTLLRAASQHLHQICIDATQLKISVCLTWEPSEHKGSEEALVDLPLYYYPDLPWGVDHVRDSIADLFESYSKPLQAGYVPVKDQKSVHSLLELIDQMIRDIDSPRLAMQAKWRWSVREIEVLNHALVKCLKPRKVRTTNPLEGLEDQKHLEIDQWCPRERMAAHEVLYVEAALPVFRLARLLLNKLSRPTNSDSLTARMTLEELNEIYATTDRMDSDLRVFAQLTLQVRRTHGGHCLRVNAHRVKKILPLLERHFDSLAAMRVEPAEVDAGRRWCRDWESHFDLAVERCLDCCGFNDADQWETDDSDHSE